MTGFSPQRQFLVYKQKSFSVQDISTFFDQIPSLPQPAKTSILASFIGRRPVFLASFCQVA
jgi:hypothetical protein